MFINIYIYKFTNNCKCRWQTVGQEVSPGQQRVSPMAEDSEAKSRSLVGFPSDTTPCFRACEGKLMSWHCVPHAISAHSRPLTSTPWTDGRTDTVTHSHILSLSLARSASLTHARCYTPPFAAISAFLSNLFTQLHIHRSISLFFCFDDDYGGGCGGDGSSHPPPSLPPSLLNFTVKLQRCEG